MIDPEVHAALMSWLAYKADLLKAREMQNSGFSIPTTSGKDFMSRINSTSRRVINALEINTPDEAEGLGELLINAAQNMKAKASPEASQRGQHLW